MHFNRMNIEAYLSERVRESFCLELGRELDGETSAQLFYSKQLQLTTVVLHILHIMYQAHVLKICLLFSMFVCFVLVLAFSFQTEKGSS